MNVDFSPESYRGTLFPTIAPIGKNEPRLRTILKHWNINFSRCEAPF